MTGWRISRAITKDRRATRGNNNSNRFVFKANQISVYYTRIWWCLYLSYSDLTLTEKVIVSIVNSTNMSNFDYDVSGQDD